MHTLERKTEFETKSSIAVVVVVVVVVVAAAAAAAVSSTGFLVVSVLSV